MPFIIQKNSATQVRGEIGEFKGRELIHLREYYLAEDGEWRPTKKGVTFSSDFIEELVEGVLVLRNEVSA